jgi:hypothetical protein
VPIIFGVPIGHDVPNVTDEPNLLDASEVFNEIDDAAYDLDVSNVLDESDIFIVTDVLDVTDIIEATDCSNVIDVTKVQDATDITDVINISNDSYDLSSNISQVTSEGEALKVHHYVDMEYDANGPPVLSSGPTPCLNRPPGKLPYPKQYGYTDLHDMSPYESLQAHVP